MATLALRGRVLDPTPAAPAIMGIVNASPESFSDGAATTLAQQVERGRALLAAGASILDVGGESGVTGGPPLDPGVEIDRVVPLVAALVALGATVSVDTWKAPVARAALEAGAHLVNDVSGLADPAVAEACAAHGAGLVVMHTRAAPKVKSFPAYADVAADVAGFLAERLDRARRLGVAAEGVVLDPGPDFAKTPAQTVAVLRDLARIAALGRPLLLAVSRKDFVGALTGRRPRARLAGTLAAVGEGLAAGASVLWVHDVAEVVDFLAVRSALRGEAEVPERLALAEHLRRERPG